MSLLTTTLPSAPWLAELANQLFDATIKVNTTVGIKDYVEKLNDNYLRKRDSPPPLPVQSDLPFVPFIENKLKDLDALRTQVEAMEIPVLPSGPDFENISVTQRLAYRLAVHGAIVHLAQAAAGISIMRRGVASLDRLDSITDRVRRAVERLALELEKLLRIPQIVVTWSALANLWIDARFSIADTVDRLRRAVVEKRRTLQSAFDQQKQEIIGLSRRISDALTHERNSFQFFLNGFEPERARYEADWHRAKAWRVELDGLRLDIIELNSQIAYLDNAIERHRTVLARLNRDLADATRELDGVRQKLNVRFEDSEFRCPNTNSYADCTHQDLKDKYDTWQNGLIRRRNELNDRNTGLRQDRASESTALQTDTQSRQQVLSFRDRSQAQLNTERPQYVALVEKLQEQWQRVFADGEYILVKQGVPLNLRDATELSARINTLSQL